MTRWLLLRAAAAMLAVLRAAAPAVAQAPAGEGVALLGAAAYDRLVEEHTTLPLTVEDIRYVGRRELDWAHGDLRAVMAELGFEGTLEDFFEHLRTDDRFYYPDTDEGRAAYLAEARRVAAEMGERLDELIEPPPALTGLDTAELPAHYPPWTTAAYGSPGLRLSASAPVLERGALLFELDDMRSAPTFLIPALTYHEGIPGHHLQWTIEQALPPAERASPQYTPAYSEGWAAYAMMLPKELGLYQDPYAEVGRLSLLAEGAARMIVDVGLHVDGWTEDEAVAFLLANTPTSERRARLEIERSIAGPATTSVYIVGMLKLQQFRALAEGVLGEDFDRRAFHAELLRHGQAPLPALEEAVGRWIAEAQLAATAANRDAARRELDRVLEDVRGVMAEVGFEGTPEDFFHFLRTDDRFYYPDTDHGRAAYLEEARRLIAEMGQRLGELIDPPPDLPPLTAEVLPEGAPAYALGQYRMSPDGGEMAFNLSDMRSTPSFLLPAFTYHEGIPGHHLQIAHAPERGRTAAFREGWAHYAERLPRELGLYQDPYAEAGRLGLEARNAARVLVMLGMQDGWTRQEAVAFMIANTPLSERQAEIDVDFVMQNPVHATAYFIGKVEIMELRARAEAALGEDFELRAFHHTILEGGAMTLPELEARIDRWIAETSQP